MKIQLMTESKNTFITLEAPSSKSLSHRYLIAAALANGVSRIRNTLESRDLECTRTVLCAAGASMRPLPADHGSIGGWEVTGMIFGPRGNAEATQPLSCDVHESGTTCRLLTAVLAAGQGFFRIHGAPRMHERPIGELAAALTQLGARIRFEQKPECPPLVLHARGLDPGLDVVRLRMDISSQYFSGLLLAAPLSAMPLCLELAGGKTVSWPYVGLTLHCLSDFGISFTVQTRRHPKEPWQTLQNKVWQTLTQPACLRITVTPQLYTAGNHTVEGDWSGASYLLAAGAVGRKPVRVQGLRGDSLQGDRALLEILRVMGARFTVAPESVTVYPSQLKGADLNMGNCPDLVPTVAALAAFANGITRIHNVAHLKVKESDRISAPAAELRKCGVQVLEYEDGMHIHGLAPGRPRLPESPLHTYNDHRIAMSLALLGMGAGNMRKRLDDPAVVKKSFPAFWDIWQRLA
ncbi:MAG: 3-phosphoshikimate 1-carboxyvinyltransferase [Candidatus Desulfovibrio kirbyi]|uniref:3-phosphoshikimate 1-carboxyvinyltransferase n=1 Tax=Candidatus Desulfovibrio kirbyi TaxID=2696086 RepID=A0A6L2R648_9BACT|nr:MAG: 3-phosphoshikimate 1-carboxyvinyltransferase [Candidatus Desulfovibrio kirbyi]